MAWVPLPLEVQVCSCRGRGWDSSSSPPPPAGQCEWPCELGGHPHGRGKPRQMLLSPLHTGQGTQPPPLTFPPGALTSPGSLCPREDVEHGNVSVAGGQLLPPPAAQGALGSLLTSQCRGQPQQEPCRLLGLPGQQGSLPRYGASPRGSALAPQIRIKGDFSLKKEKRKTRHIRWQRPPNPVRLKWTALDSAYAQAHLDTAILKEMREFKT